MFRAIIELIIVVFAVVIARTLLTTIARGIARASYSARQNPDLRDSGIRNRGSSPSAAPSAGDLHKDPVCGTYVAESTPFRRQVGPETFYYCSENCRDQHKFARRSA